MAQGGDPGTDLVRQVTEEATAEVGAFIGTIFGSASIEADRLIGDRVGWWRWKQSVKLAKKAKALMDAEGLAAQEVPLRTSVPLMEQGSLAEDEPLVERWASLLANVASGAQEVPPSFANVLAEIETRAAQLLDQIYETHMTLAPDLRLHFFVVTEIDGMGEDENTYHIDNLVRLGLIRSGGTTLAGEFYSRLQLTAFGTAFVRACQPPGTPTPAIKWTDKAALEADIAKRKQREAEALVRSDDAAAAV